LGYLRLHHSLQDLRKRRLIHLDRRGRLLHRLTFGNSLLSHQFPKFFVFLIHGL
jgi:hypothetical protein